MIGEKKEMNIEEERHGVTKEKEANE